MDLLPNISEFSLSCWIYTNLPEYIFTTLESDSPEKYFIQDDGVSNVVIKYDWSNSFARKSFLRDVFDILRRKLSYGYDVDFDSMSGRSSAGEIRIVPKEGKMEFTNKRIRRFSIVCKPMSGTPAYAECETYFAEAMNKALSENMIRCVDFVEKSSKTNKYGFGTMHNTPAFDACTHVGSKGGKADIEFSGQYTAKISLKMSNAEYVSKQCDLINDAILEHYYVGVDEYRGERYLQMSRKGANIFHTFPLTHEYNLSKPKRVYLHCPDAEVVDKALFGSGEDRVSLVCILGDNVFEIDDRLKINTQRDKLEYHADKILDPYSMAPTLTQDVCICIRNADNGRKGLKLTNGNYLPSLLPTMVFRKERPYSVPIP